MGLRGKLPRLRTTRPGEAELAPPEWLGDEAKAYWSKHAPWCKENNLLTAQTADNFAVMCRLWEQVRTYDGPTTRLYLDTLKAYQSLAKLFRLLPTDKPGEQPTRYDDKEEFDFA